MSLPSYRDTVLADTPIVFLRLNDYVATARDQTGQNDGSYQGGYTQQQAGPLTRDPDTGTLLNGTTGYVNGPVAAQIATSTFSVDGWVKPTATPAATAAIASCRNGTASGFIFYLDTAGKLNGAIYNGTAHSIAASTSVVANTTWAHVALTYDGNNLTSYINGVQAATSALGAVYTIPTLGLNFGRDPGSGSNFLNGAEKDMAFNTYSLSAAQIAAHYAAR